MHQNFLLVTWRPNCWVKTMSNDQTKAAALMIAERKLQSLGWKYSIEDIGIYAAKLINAMEKELNRSVDTKS